MSRLILIGKGAHSDVVMDAVIKDNRHSIMCRLAEGDPDWRVIGDNNHWAHIAIGDNAARERLSKLPYKFVNIVHPLAEFSPQECVGSYFGAFSVIGPHAKVGNFCIINTAVVLEHDSVVADYTHLAPGVVTGGRVKIGSRTFVGLGTIIRDGITIGDNCTIGMGSVVLKNIPDNSTAYGNPCRLSDL